MEGFWAVFFMAVILKIPVVALLGIVWWAIRQVPDPDEAYDGDDGGSHRQLDPRRPRPRGPHGPVPLPLPDCPPGGRRRLATATVNRKTATRVG